MVITIIVIKNSIVTAANRHRAEESEEQDNKRGASLLTDESGGLHLGSQEWGRVDDETLAEEFACHLTIVGRDEKTPWTDLEKMPIF